MFIIYDFVMILKIFFFKLWWNEDVIYVLSGWVDEEGYFWNVKYGIYMCKFCCIMCVL